MITTGDFMGAVNGALPPLALDSSSAVGVTNPTLASQAAGGALGVLLNKDSSHFIAEYVQRMSGLRLPKQMSGEVNDIVMPTLPHMPGSNEMGRA